MVCNSVEIGQNLQNVEVFIKYSTVSLLKCPLRGYSDLIYKMEQRKKNEKKTNLQI